MGEQSFSVHSLAQPQVGFAAGSGARPPLPVLDTGVIDRAYGGVERPTTTNPEPATLASALVGLSLAGMLKRRIGRRPAA